MLLIFFNSAQKIPISCYSNEIQDFDYFYIAVAATTSSTISPSGHVEVVVDEDQENRVTKTSKKLISTKWILGDYENMHREITRRGLLLKTSTCETST